MAPGDVLPLPSNESPRRLKERLGQGAPWFYRYVFSNGVETDGPDPTTQAVHDARAHLIFPLLDRIVGERWGASECVDLACHEGWFAMQLAARGAAAVRGVDIREEHVDKANLIKDVAGLTNVTFEQRDLYGLNPAELGTFDVTLFLGLLYHLDNPVGALRIVRSLTRGVCVIETQVSRPADPLQCLWGSGEARSGPGIAVVPSDPTHVQDAHDVVLVPTLDALFAILHAVGFRHLSLAIAPPGEFDQYTAADRVVVFAFV